MHARVDRQSGKPTYDRSFCIRMKSTLTKRGCHFKSSGYRVVLLLGKVRESNDLIDQLNIKYVYNVYSYDLDQQYKYFNFISFSFDQQTIDQLPEIQKENPILIVVIKTSHPVLEHPPTSIIRQESILLQETLP